MVARPAWTAGRVYDAATSPRNLIRILAGLVELSPAQVLSMWAAGVAAGAALVSWWRVVGRGYGWLAGGVALLLGVPAGLAGGGALVWVGCGLVGVLIAVASHHRRAAGAAGLAALVFGLAAAAEGNAVATVTGAAFLGAVTVEMLLGHWYLVDPRLPRWALSRLAWAGAGSAGADFLIVAMLGAIPWSRGDAPLGWGFVALAAASLILMLGVVGALREEGYPGVMAATGLSYLALLTAIGATVVGRLVADAPVVS